jgi:hypothetical protein
MKMTWRDDLPEELREHPAIADIPDVLTLAKSYRDSQQQIGRLSQDAIRRPSEDASSEDITAALDKVQKRWPELMLRPDETDPEQWSKVMRSMGHPEDPEGYKIDIEEEVAQAHQDMLANLKQIGHKAQLTKRQFAALAKAMVDQRVQAGSEAQESIRQQKEALTEEWGAAYKRNLRAIKAMVEKTEAPEILVRDIDKGTASPEVLRWLYGMVQSLGGEASEIHRQQGDGMEITPAEAQELIDDINRNRDHDYHHPERGDAHRRAREKMHDLYRIKQGKNYTKATAIYGVGT